MKKELDARLRTPGMTETVCHSLMVCSADTAKADELMQLVCKDLDGIAPAEIQVIPAGFHQTPKGDFLCDEEAAALVLAAFDGQRNDMVADYEHQTLEEPPVQAPAAGWIKRLINRGPQGIWAVVEWTDRARQFIANREYRYISPVFLKRRSDNKVVRLINIGLTNQPNIDGMVPLINKQAAPAAAAIEKEEGCMKELWKLLGLPETATEADAVAAVNKLMAGQQVAANKEVLDALGLAEGAAEAEVTGTIMAMKQSHDGIEALTTQLGRLTEQLRKRDADDIEAVVNSAVEDGKITPAQKDWALDYAKRDAEGFKVFVAKAPRIVTRERVAGDAGAAGRVSKADETQQQVNRMLGVSDEAFKKFGTKKKEE